MTNENPAASHGGQFFKRIGEDFSHLEKSKDIINADVHDAWFNASPKVIQKLQRNLNFIVRTSPPNHCDGLIRTISEIRGIPKENILVGNGSSGIIFTFFQHQLKNHDKVLILDPSYSEYRHVISNIVGANIVSHFLKKENEFKINSAEFIQQICDEQPKMVVLVNPNSPTGQYLEKEELLKVLKNIPQDVCVVVDETYLEYVDSKKSLEKEILNFSNLIVIKSMSKVYALSGLRIGYLVANKGIVQELKKITPPWVVGLAGQVAGVEALKSPDYYQEKYSQTHEMREGMIRDLSEINSIRIYNSCANFFLIELLDKNLSANAIIEKLQKKNIFVRSCDTMGSCFEDNFIRVAIKNYSSNKKIVQELKKVLEQKNNFDGVKAIIFDMDGVIVDTEGFGIDIVCNLCKDLGVEISKEERDSFIGITYKKVFTDLKQKYNFSYDVDEILKKHHDVYDELLKTKLKDFEGAKTLPQKLKEKGFKLAIVSGSTRKQIEIILNSLEIAKYFDVIISCDEVKNSKPNSEGYLLGASKLGVLPHECVVIEDADAGVKAGKDAGMRVIGIAQSSGQDLVLADARIVNLSEAENIIENFSEENFHSRIYEDLSNLYKLWRDTMIGKKHSEEKEVNFICNILKSSNEKNFSNGNSYAFPTSTTQQNYEMNSVGKKNISIIDLGGGVGIHSIPLQNCGFDVTLFDQSKKALGIAKQKYPKLKTIQGSFETINIKNKFDSAICMWSTFDYVMNEYSRKHYFNWLSNNINNTIILDQANFCNYHEKYYKEYFGEDENYKLKITRDWTLDKTANIRKTNYIYDIENIQTGKKEKINDYECQKFLTSAEVKKLLGENWKLKLTCGDYDVSQNFEKESSERMILVFRRKNL